MPINKTIYHIILLLISSTTIFSQSGGKYSVKFSSEPFQCALISTDHFTPTINKEYTSFDVNLIKREFRISGHKKLKNKWSLGLGVGVAQTKTNWVIGYDKTPNSAFFNTLSTESNQVTININVLLGYQILNNTELKFALGPNFRILSTSSQDDVLEQGSLSSSTGFRADYREVSGRYGSLFSSHLQFETTLISNLYLNYGINVTYYWGMYYYEMIGQQPLLNPNEKILEVNIGGLVPFLHLGVGYKFNSQ